MKKPPLIDQLKKETWRFEFYKAVQILEKMQKDDETLHPVAATVDARQEPVHFQSRVDVRFPASQLDSLTQTEQNRPQLKVNFMSLAGIHGPLPQPYTELMIERAWQGDHAMQAFLDIFNHRLVGLMYRQRAQQRVGYGSESPWQSRFANALFSLMGMGTLGTRQRMQIEDQALLHYAGIIQHEPHSLTALETMLADYFQVPIETVPFVGQWVTLPDDECTQISAHLGQHNGLGSGAALGSKVWDQQGKFRVEIGALSLLEYKNFLPIGWGFVPLCEMTRFYVGAELDFEIKLLLKIEEVPDCLLDEKKGARLGWTSWLKSKPFTQSPDITLQPKQHLDKSRENKISFLSYLPPQERENLMGKTSVKHVPIHTIILKQGALGEHLYVISTGEVQVIYEDLKGKHKKLNNLSAGDFFGEGALMRDGGRTASVIAASDCKLLEINHADIKLLMKKHPRIRQVIETQYFQRLADNN